MTAHAGPVAVIDGVVESAQAKPLHLVKAFYFLNFLHFATCCRYLSLYFQADGLSATEIGTLWAVYRVIGIATTPIWASLADRTKRARDIVQLSLVCCAVPFLLLGFSVEPTGNAFILRAATFWAFAICVAPRAALVDALAIAACEKDVGRWGKARLYGAVAWGLAYLALGLSIDSMGFVVLFVAFVFLGIFAFIITYFGVPQACGKVQKSASCREVCKIFLNNRLFFANVIAIGAGIYMVEGMLFLHLQKMKASTLLCGLSVMMSVVFEVPIFHYANKLMERLGYRWMILLGQTVWVVRALFYAHMSAPWTALLIEPLHGITFALVWTAATQYVANPWVSGEGLEASAQGLLLVCFKGVGPFLGLTLGGWLFDTIGSRLAFHVFAYLVLLIGLIYARWGGIEASNREAMFSSAGPKLFELTKTSSNLCVDTNA